MVVAVASVLRLPLVCIALQCVCVGMLSNNSLDSGLCCCCALIVWSHSKRWTTAAVLAHRIVSDVACTEKGTCLSLCLTPWLILHSLDHRNRHREVNAVPDNSNIDSHLKELQNQGKTHPFAVMLYVALLHNASALAERLPPSPLHAPAQTEPFTVP